jgi:hypothetical protein
MVFTPEPKIFVIEFYFRNGHENGVLVYQTEPAFQEFTEKFPNVLYEHFSETLRYTVHRFRESGSVQRKSGSG